MLYIFLAPVMGLDLWSREVRKNKAARPHVYSGLEGSLGEQAAEQDLGVGVPQGHSQSTDRHFQTPLLLPFWGGSPVNRTMGSLWKHVTSGPWFFRGVALGSGETDCHSPHVTLGHALIYPKLICVARTGTWALITEGDNVAT